MTGPRPLNGFVLHDVEGKSGGTGDTTYADAGVFEFDIPPAKITDLQCTAEYSIDADLQWTAPGDDGNTGTAQIYEIRYSTSPIVTESDWANADTLDSVEPSPQHADSVETHHAYYFPEYETTYYLVMKTRDTDNQLWSEMSDPETLTTLACCTTGFAMKPNGKDQRVAESTAGRVADATAMPITEAVVVEVERSGNQSDWMVYATEASDWTGGDRGNPPFVLVQKSDGSGGWFDTGVHPYAAQPVGIPEPLGGEGRVILVGPRGIDEMSRTVGGGAWSLSSAEHSRLGVMTNDLGTADHDLSLGVGDTLHVSYVHDTEAGGKEGGAVFIVRSASAASQTSAKRLGEVPRVFALAQNYPNPFASVTTLRFDLPRAADVRLDVFDLLGRRIARLANGSFEPGYHSVTWDRTGRNGQQVKPGIYMYRLHAGKFRSEKKMVLVP